jgi:hypothetical protein
VKNIFQVFPLTLGHTWEGAAVQSFNRLNQRLQKIVILTPQKNL